MHALAQQIEAVMPPLEQLLEGGAPDPPGDDRPGNVPPVAELLAWTTAASSRSAAVARPA